jgi:hypothetical protein
MMSVLLLLLLLLHGVRWHFFSFFRDGDLSLSRSFSVEGSCLLFLSFLSVGSSPALPEPFSFGVSRGRGVVQGTQLAVGSRTFGSLSRQRLRKRLG